MSRIRHPAHGVDAEPGPADPDELDDRIAAGSARYRKLPARVAQKDMVAEQPVGSPPDPEGGRNPDRDWLLRGN